MYTDRFITIRLSLVDILTGGQQLCTERTLQQPKPASLNLERWGDAR